MRHYTLWMFQSLAQDPTPRSVLTGMQIHAASLESTGSQPSQVPASEVGLGHGPRQNYLEVNEA